MLRSGCTPNPSTCAADSLARAYLAFAAVAAPGSLHLLLGDGGKHAVDSHRTAAFVDALVLHLFDVGERVHGTAEIGFPGFGVRCGKSLLVFT